MISCDSLLTPTNKYLTQTNLLCYWLYYTSYMGIVTSETVK